MVEGHTKTEVCNAISSLAWTLAGTLVNVTEGKTSIDDSDGYLLVSLDQDSTVTTNTVFETIIVGLTQLSKSYPDLIGDIVYMIKPEMI